MSDSAPSSTPAVRGFIIDRSNGQASLPGSLHTNRRLSQWIDLRTPQVVRVHTGKVELGQGILTALRLLAAEELDVALEQVHICRANTAQGPDEGVTSGSLSIQDSGGALRHACAEIRGMALARAAVKFGLTQASSITVVNGQLQDASGRTLGDYWNLLDPVDLDIEFQGLHAPKRPDQRRLLGQKDVLRVDLSDKVLGHARFIQDMKLPGMRHGRVLRAPLLKAQLVQFPAPETLHLPDGVRYWRDGQFVAVVADREHDAETAATRIGQALVWQGGDALPDGHALPEFLRQSEHQTTVPVERGDTTWLERPAPQGQRFHAEYFKSYLAHASIGPSCAVARWTGQQLEVWTHSQGIHNLRDDIVLALSQHETPVAKQDITIHHVEGSGCYGHNGADDVAFDAVLMALACPNQPVRVLWSRSDELIHSPLGAAQLVALDAQVDETGTLTHWQHALWANGYSSRPGRATTPTLLAASQRQSGSPLPLPINPPFATGGGADRNAEPGYALPHLKVINNRLMTMPLRTSAMRGLGAYANVFAIESFMDEMAHSLGQSPLAFRKKHMQDERALTVLDTVVARSAWWGQRDHEAEGIGHGMAWARYKNTGAWCAVLARVQMTQEVRVLNLDLAVDVGMVVDLDGVINQIEGGAIQSTSWTLKEQVTFADQRVTSEDWISYPVLRFSEVPQVTVHVVDRPDAAPLGAGEAAQGPVAAALANALFDALGVRVRQLPLSPDNILKAIHGDDAC